MTSDPMKTYYAPDNVGDYRDFDHMPFTIDSTRSYTAEEAQARNNPFLSNPLTHSGGFYTFDTPFVSFGTPDIAIGLPGGPSFNVDDPRISDRSAAPDNPGIRIATASTYGNTIPVSFGRRRLPGNIIQSSDLVPFLVGNGTQDTSYDKPTYEDPPAAGIGSVPGVVFSQDNDHCDLIHWLECEPDDGTCGSNGCDPKGGGGLQTTGDPYAGNYYWGKTTFADPTCSPVLPGFSAGPFETMDDAVADIGTACNALYHIGIYADLGAGSWALLSCIHAC